MYIHVSLLIARCSSTTCILYRSAPLYSLFILAVGNGVFHSLPKLQIQPSNAIYWLHVSKGRPGGHVDKQVANYIGNYDGCEPPKYTHTPTGTMMIQSRY